MRRSKLLFALVPVTALLAVSQGGGIQPTVVHAFDPTKAPEIQDRLLDSVGGMEYGLAGSNSNGAKLGNYQPSSASGCANSIQGNIKVNQNCLNITDADLQGRGQAQNETSIATDPTNSKNLVASSNDYRRGDGNCYSEFSSNGGQTWTDSTPPMGFTRGTGYAAGGGNVAREYWQSGGDTSVAYDTKGNAYLSCQMFQRGAGTTNNPDLSSAFFVFRSTGNNGASWNFPARPVAQAANQDGNQPVPFLDKQLMTVDNHVGSPFQDRIYVTWTSFAPDGTSYIYGAWSNNYGESFSAPVVVSGSTPACAFTYGFATPNGPCNENQFSQPFTGSDGALYVAWANFNNAEVAAAQNGGADNRNQMLLAKSTDGGKTFSTPVRVGYYFDLPDCSALTGAGRACVPEKSSTTTHSIFRAVNYPSGAVNPTNPGQVVVTFGSYINKDSKESNGCTPAGIDPNQGTNIYTGTKTPGACNNDILVSVSSNGGASFSNATTDPRTAPDLTTKGAQTTTDQWWQWAAFTSKGDLAVSYYDRQYGNDETTGWSDVSLTAVSAHDQGDGQGNHQAPSDAHLQTVRVTSSSMPPPTQFGGVFFGDYTGLTTSGNNAVPLWMDTRSTDLFLCPGTGTAGHAPSLCTATEGTGPQQGLTANDQDIFTALVNVSH